MADSEGTSRLGRPESPLDPQDGPVQHLAWQLRRLREQAGAPSYRALSRRALYSPSTLAEAAKGDRLPTREVTLAYARACGGDRAEWAERWQEAAAALAVRRADTASTVSAVACPYPGLTALQPEDADVFFGRGSLVEEVRDRLEEARLVALFGASGSGKSSLVRAGLLPSLTDRRQAVLVTPGARPLAALAAGLAAPTGLDPDDLTARLRTDPAALGTEVAAWLAGQPSDREVVLVVDQFEECFTLCADETERTAFLTALAECARPTAPSRTAANGTEPAPVRHAAPADGLRLVLAVRSDFYPHCTDHPGLADALRAGVQLPLAPPTADELREIITGPAVKAGMSVEDELVRAVLADAEGQPGALPLIAHALRETWFRATRVGTVLRYQDYRDTGGVRGALTRTAEEVHAATPPEQRQWLREVFVRLTALGEETADTRRRTDVGELTGLSDPGAVSLLLERLAARRLVVLSDDTAEVAHEAVISAWPRLRRWLHEDRERLRLHRRLTDDARTWDALGEDPGALYRGARLAAAREQLADAGHELSRRERAFLAASTAAAEAEARAEGDRARRLRRLSGALACLLVLALVAVAAAVREYRGAREERSVAVSRELAARAGALSAAGQPEKALLTALVAQRRSDTLEARSSLLSAYGQYEAGRFTGHNGPVSAVEFLPGGRTLVTSGSDHSIKLWDPVDGRLLATLTGHTAAVTDLSVSADGRMLASVGKDRSLKLWDLAARREIATLTGHRANALSVNLSPDGRTVVTTGDDGTARLWDVVTRRPLHTFESRGGSVLDAAVSPDGRTLATAALDGTLRLWDLATRRETAHWTAHGDSARDVSFGPDGRHLASVGDDGALALWDARTHRRIAVATAADDDFAYTVVHSPDGRTLATSARDGTARLWDAATLRPLATLTTPGSLPDVAFSRDGRTLATAGIDGAARLWDVAGRRPTHVLARPASLTVMGAAISPDGRTLATINSDGTVELRDLRTRTVTDSFRAHGSSAMAAAFSPDGTMLATVGLDGAVSLFDLSARRVTAVLRGHAGPVLGVSFSPDGRLLATAGYDRTVRLWDPERGTSTAVLRGYDAPVTVAAFSPDGRTVATAGGDRVIRLVDVATRTTVRTLPGHASTVLTLAFAPDGRTLASGGHDRTVRLWDPSGDRRPTVLTGHGSTVSAAGFSPDGRTLATADYGGGVHLWDTATGQPSAVLSGHTEQLFAAVFSPREPRLVTVGGKGAVRQWTTRTDEVAAQVCPLARAHSWGRLLPDLPVTSPCTEPSPAW